MASSAFWKLRRLAARAIRVVDRRGKEIPAVKTFETTLKPKAQAFVTAYDQALKYESTAKRELKEGKDATAELLKIMKTWVPVVAKDVGGLNAADFGDRPSVPDDVIEDAGRLHDIVTDYKDGSGAPLAYQAECLSALTPAIKKAEKEWAEAETEDKKYQDLLAKTRSTAEGLDIELQALRKTLASAVGRSDKDFQKLRAQRAFEKDEDDDSSTAPAPATATAPAPAETPSK